MAAVDRSEVLPITPDEAADELVAAGRVVGLAQRALLESFGVSLRARQVQLQRELIYTAAAFGNGSPEAASVAARLDRHKRLATEIAEAEARVAMPIPAPDKRAAVIFGRVVDRAGASRGAVIEAVSSAGEMLASATADRNGHYELRLDQDVRPDDVQIRVRRPESHMPVRMAAPNVARGVRLFNEIVLPEGDRPAEGPREKGSKDAEQPPATGRARATASIVVPNVVGAELEGALLALRDAGLNVGDVEGAIKGAVVTRQVPRAKAKVKPGTRVVLKVGKKG